MSGRGDAVGEEGAQLCAKWILHYNLGFQLRFDAEACTTTQLKIHSLS